MSLLQITENANDKDLNANNLQFLLHDSSLQNSDKNIGRSTEQWL